MKIHYDHARHGWLIESRVLAWLVDHAPSSARVWKWTFIAAYVVCVAWLCVELAGWMGGVGLMEMAKLIIEVQAGVIPGEGMPEYTRRWGWSSEDQARLEANDAAARELYVRIAGESREYAASLEDPRRVNWVRRDWIWL